MNLRRHTLISALYTTLTYLVIAALAVLGLTFLPNAHSSHSTVHTLFFFLYWLVPIAILIFGMFQVFKKTMRILGEDPGAQKYSSLLTFLTLVVYLLTAPTILIFVILLFFAVRGGSF